MKYGGREPVPDRGVCEGHLLHSTVAKNNNPGSGFKDDLSQDISHAKKHNHQTRIPTENII